MPFTNPLARGGRHGLHRENNRTGTMKRTTRRSGVADAVVDTGDERPVIRVSKLTITLLPAVTVWLENLASDCCGRRRSGADPVRFVLAVGTG